MATPKNQSVMKAFSLLQSFRGEDEWLTSSELSRRARLPEASGYRLVQTLEGIGAVVRDGRGRYRPGMLLLSLSAKVSARDLWGKVPQALLDDLAGAMDTSIQVGVFEDGMVSHVARAGRPRPGLPGAVGMHFEAYPTAIGKVLLAALDAAALDAFLLDGELVALTSRTIVDADRLRGVLADVRAEGHAIDDRETLDTLACVAVPILDPGGRTVAAISASDEVSRVTPGRHAQLRAALDTAADAIGHRLFPWRTPMPRPRRAADRILTCGTQL